MAMNSMPQHAVTNGYLKSEYFSGPGEKRVEPRGREALLSALRIRASVRRHRFQFSHSSAPFFQHVDERHDRESRRKPNI